MRTLQLNQSLLNAGKNIGSIGKSGDDSGIMEETKRKNGTEIFISLRTYFLGPLRFQDQLC